jgi:hypothetical protein
MFPDKKLMCREQDYSPEYYQQKHPQLLAAASSIVCLLSQHPNTPLAPKTDAPL